MQRDTLKAYSILGVEPGAPAKQVRQAYFDLLQTWDPEKHIRNPRLRTVTEKRRKEIQAAYLAIRHFLPELQGPQDPEPKKQRVTRDFQELAVTPHTETSRGLMGVVAGLVLVVVMGAALYLYRVGVSYTPPPEQVQPVVQE